jgi:hypothetical protein
VSFEEISDQLASLDELDQDQQIAILDQVVRALEELVS